MKTIKPAKPKLTIHRETLRRLSTDDLKQVGGGTNTWFCTFITFVFCPVSADTCESHNALCATLTIEDNG
jgi:hypothetical protein